MSTEKYAMMLKQFHSFPKGTVSAKLILIACIFALSGLVITGIQVFQLLTLSQDYHKLRSAIESQLQSISTLRIPDSKVAIVTQIHTILDSIGAQYEPHHVQVHFEKTSQRLTVQVWYWQPHRALFIDNPKMFYASAEKVGFLEIVEQQSTLTPISIPVTDVNTSASSKQSSKPAAPIPAKTPKSVKTPKPVATAIQASYTIPIKVTDANFQEMILQSPVPVLVDFWAEWCGPCRQAAPSVDAAAREFSGQVMIAKLNIDQNKRTSAHYSVRGIPTFLLFKNGQVVGRQTGFGGKQTLFTFIRRYI